MGKLPSLLLLPGALSFPLFGAGGNPPSPPREDLRFQLPYPPAASYRVLYGPGDAPHHLNPRNRHAYDFDLPLGSEVCASAAGVVVRAESRFLDRPTGRSEDNNFIALRHEDGLVSEYHHLLQDGVLVLEGERVEQGEVIGFSGTSGKAGGPHLHFVVLRGDESQPVEFAGYGKPPVKGDLCTSKNAPPALKARYETLRRAEDASDLLLGEGNRSGAARVLERILERPAEAAGTPNQRRQAMALRFLEATLEAKRKAILPEARGPIQISTGKAER